MKQLPFAIIVSLLWLIFNGVLLLTVGKISEINFFLAIYVPLVWYVVTANGYDRLYRITQLNLKEVKHNVINQRISKRVYP